MGPNCINTGIHDLHSHQANKVVSTVGFKSQFLPDNTVLGLGLRFILGVCDSWKEGSVSVFRADKSTFMKFFSTWKKATYHSLLLFQIFRHVDKWHRSYQRKAKWISQEMYAISQQIAHLLTQLTLNHRVAGSSLTVDEGPFWNSMAQKRKIKVQVDELQESADGSGRKSANL